MRKRIWLVDGSVITVFAEDADYLRAEKWQVRQISAMMRGDLIHKVWIFRTAIMMIES